MPHLPIKGVRSPNQKVQTEGTITLNSIVRWFFGKYFQCHPFHSTLNLAPNWMQSRGDGSQAKCALLLFHSLHAGSYLTTIALAVERLNAMRSPGGSPSANPLLHGGCYPMRKERAPISISLLAILLDCKTSGRDFNLTSTEKFNNLSHGLSPSFLKVSAKVRPTIFFLPTCCTPSAAVVVNVFKSHELSNFQPLFTKP